MTNSYFINEPKGLIRPFLRWAGSKRQILPVLSQYWNSQFTRYVEPFAGSASLFFHLAPQKALLGDINTELISTFEQVKNNLPSVLVELRRLKKSQQDYRRIRALSNKDLSSASRAARFIYLNRYCFNGLYRTNRAGIFNVPYGADKSGEMPSNEVFECCSNSLKNAELLAGDFESTLERVVKGDFVYMDPPFSVKAKRIFHQYDASVFNQDALIRLREWLIQLDKRKVSFLVSYADSEEGFYLSKGFYIEKIIVRRNISGFSRSRRKATELLISNCVPNKLMNSSLIGY